MKRFFIKSDIFVTLYNESTSVEDTAETLVYLEQYINGLRPIDLPNKKKIALRFHFDGSSIKEIV